MEVGLWGQGGPARVALGPLGHMSYPCMLPVVSFGAGKSGVSVSALSQAHTDLCLLVQQIGWRNAGTGEKVFYLLKSILNQWHHLLAAIPIVTVPGGVAGPWGCGTEGCGQWAQWRWGGVGLGDLRGLCQPE